jgi:hypothetical protein
MGMYCFFTAPSFNSLKESALNPYQKVVGQTIKKIRITDLLLTNKKLFKTALPIS